MIINRINTAKIVEYAESLFITSLFFSTMIAIIIVFKNLRSVLIKNFPSYYKQ